MVELTLACIACLIRHEDRFCFDVSHQGYIHKLLTGRNDERFDHIRTSEGYSGFLRVPRANTMLSAQATLAPHFPPRLVAVARDKRGTAEHVVALCGDAAFTCGITMEALNNVAGSTKRLIIILNDNKWSIAKNVALSLSLL